MTKTHSNDTNEHRRSMQNWFLGQYLEISFFHRPERQTVAAVSLLLTQCHWFYMWHSRFTGLVKFTQHNPSYFG